MAVGSDDGAARAAPGSGHHALRREASDSYFPASLSSGTHGLRRRHSTTANPDPGAWPNTDEMGRAQPSDLTLQGMLPPPVTEEDGDLDAGAPPSPSTLTDIILTLHASLYGAKRSVDEIRETVWRYYENDAVFDSPLVSAHGRDRIVDQFILAFSMPGMDVHSELRDVICSDFEFDGTRAGIIDQTINVTLFPYLFRASGLDEGPTSAMPVSGSVTPHPFASYLTPTTSEGMFSANRSGNNTDNLASPMPHRFSYARGRTPSQGGETLLSTPRNGTPAKPLRTSTDVSGSAIASDDLGSSDSGPRLTTPRWSAAQGLGRSTVWALLFQLINPMRTLRSLLTIELRLLVRGAGRAAPR